MISISRKALEMLMSLARRVAMEVLVELTGLGSQAWMKGRMFGQRIDADSAFRVGIIWILQTSSSLEEHRVAREA